VDWPKRYLLSRLDDIRACAVVLAAAETAAVRGVFYIVCYCLLPVIIIIACCYSDSFATS
jgi:hypothetical protein